jgi:hypothetical protein
MPQLAVLAHLVSIAQTPTMHAKVLAVCSGEIVLKKSLKSLGLPWIILKGKVFLLWLLEKAAVTLGLV